ncbi:MAG: phosphoenolpyruvate carboxylase [Phycisphaeraceae bacterium]|nr:phosphoenolpyruvate carboxylase [Phycisphaeraceae bacterium]
MSENEPTTTDTPPDFPLRRDVRMLGYELGKVLKSHGSDGLYDLVEEVRALAKGRRDGDAEADQTLRGRIASMSEEELGELMRALACFFDLANLAEDRHRIRVLREREQDTWPRPRNQSLGHAITKLADEGVTAAQMQAMLDELDVDLVFTAHPTEAKRRTTRLTLRRLRDDLIQLDRPDMLHRERDELVRRIRSDLDCLWETDTLRPNKPSVLEEVDRSLFVIDSLWEVVPQLCYSTRRALEQAYPQNTPTLPVVIRFGSWIGGDRDGNPFVNEAVTRETLLRLRRAIIAKHVEQCRQLARVLSISDKHHPLSEGVQAIIGDALERWPGLKESIEQVSPHESYRRALRVIRHRLIASTEGDVFANDNDLAYRSGAELAADLKAISQSLQDNGHDELANGALRGWRDRVDVFGLHFARLDIREDSRQLHSAIGEVLSKLDSPVDYAALDERSKQALLTSPIDLDVDRFDGFAWTEATRKTINLFRLLELAAETLGTEALGALIISMTHEPSDVLAMLWLGRLGSALAGNETPRALLPIAPLFETIDDLANADKTLDALLSSEPYMAHVKATGGRQMCMVGYSDSCKDGGYLASNFGLFDAQTRLANTAKQHNIGLVLFHGRGGALGRGGGPAARGVLSLPPEAVGYKVRITEQGEVLSERYDDPEVAFRHVEQVAWATLLVSAEQADMVDPSWIDTLAQASQASTDCYRSLRDDPAFLAYFDRATPINTIETMPIGSRPSRRRGARELKDLRAIPYTFAWTQNRHLLTGWYGLGTGLSGIDLDTRRAMYAGWPMFRGMIHNAELALAKCDMQIAKHYAELVDDGQATRLFETICTEFDRTRALVLETAQRDDLLSGIDWLQRSVRVRNPYVDPLNLIQVELIRRGLDPQGDLLRQSVQAIAAGLRNTG